jgi:hypothetical protein
LCELEAAGQQSVGRAGYARQEHTLA